MEWRPAVLIVENLQTLLSLPELPGVIALHGGGYDVRYVLRFLGWCVSRCCTGAMLIWMDWQSWRHCAACGSMPDQ
ncbi:hypothetical protein EKH49_11455 [Glutamicibacter sp. HZAU]|nr:hypothetical protein EKH49_11455 [Glutamicibacter sp. HZAU]